MDKEQFAAMISAISVLTERVNDHGRRLANMERLISQHFDMELAEAKRLAEMKWWEKMDKGDLVALMSILLAAAAHVRETLR
jgi:hypothetical protein